MIVASLFHVDDRYVGIGADFERAFLRGNAEAFGWVLGHQRGQLLQAELAFVGCVEHERRHRFGARHAGPLFCENKNFYDINRRNYFIYDPFHSNQFCVMYQSL